ncbi:flagellar motor switch protein FliM [Lachnoclostridium phytofermentans]|uniref:Flagellar motor switch protein FliM n=1 Tax=Lachnoclostridium phytofermentans (strain ATCC 700394 / DSM 18823 / ISDg) TaxID=357809 RepID=A9KNE7_LACP7|nr:flagellar motor switch protein FliM [Lachnoclostridium phytofermentans]ABX43064.1 flagellar motor switch protein FliM [Lachnoclostridium phytofermentans ISDg]
MGDVLSQSEIDNLLAALSSGELDADEFRDSGEKAVKNYDFHRPSKFSKEHLRTLDIIFEHYGRLLSTHLPAYLRKNVQVEVINSEAVVYQEFTNALSNPVLLGIIDFAPLEGNIIIELAENVGYAIVDRMLGGSGNPLEKSRDFSEIELVIIERIFTVMTNILAEPWANVVKLNPRLIRIETNSQFAQIISPSDMASIVTLNIKIGNIEGMMNVCLPYACLEVIIDKLNTKYWYSTMQEKGDSNYQEFIETAISRARIPVKAVLGKSSISLNELINMQKGDIIKLDRKIDDELSVYVGNIKKFTALPGASSDSYAVKISTIIREE